MDIKEHSKYWIDSAEHDLESAEILYASAKYVWCLFLVHIVIEKAIKAIFVLSNNNDTPPKIHNLVRLAQLSRLELTDEQIDLLDRINDFNLEARYPDYKFSFYKLCTEDFATEYFNKAKELFAWIKSRTI